MAVEPTLESIKLVSKNRTLRSPESPTPVRKKFRYALVVFSVPGEFDDEDISSKITLAIDVTDKEASVVEVAWATLRRWLEAAAQHASAKP